MHRTGRGPLALRSMPRTARIAVVAECGPSIQARNRWDGGEGGVSKGRQWRPATLSSSMRMRGAALLALA